LLLALRENVSQVENRFQIEMLQVSAVDSRHVSGQRPDEIERLMKQARVLYEQGEYDQSLNASDGAAQSLFTRSVVLRHELRSHTDGN
jgi:hypothetical protein